MLVRVHVRTPDGAISIRMIDGERIDIGRDPACDLVIAASSCSWRHAVLASPAPDQFVIEDLYSSNGTRLNGVPVTQAVVRKGDVVTVARHDLTLLNIERLDDQLPLAHLPPSQQTLASAYSQSIESLEMSLEVTRKETRALIERASKKKIPKNDQLNLHLEWELRFDKLQTLRRQVFDANVRLNLLFEAFQAINSELDIKSRMAACIDLLIDALQADCGCLAQCDEKSTSYTIPVKRGLEEIGLEQTNGSMPPRHVELTEGDPSLQIIKYTLQQAKPLFIPSMERDSRFDSAQSVVTQRILAAACVPMKARGKLIGALYIDFRNIERFDDARMRSDDQEFMTAFAHQAALALHNSRLLRNLEIEVTRRDNFQRFLSPQVTRQIMQHEIPLELGGKRTWATVLFADVRNFTALSEQIAPTLLIKQLNEFFSTLIEIIFRAKGAVDKFAGDSLLATFGAPVALENQEIHAVRAAAAMQRMMLQLGQYWKEKKRPQFKIGVGIHQGEVVAGAVGSQKRMEYTVIGDVVNVASRICSIAGPGQILVGKSVADRVSSEYEIRSLGQQTLKGKTTETEVFEVGSPLKKKS